jgi:hypothetical protein
MPLFEAETFPYLRVRIIQWRLFPEPKPYCIVPMDLENIYEEMADGGYLYP